MMTFGLPSYYSLPQPVLNENISSACPSLKALYVCRFLFDLKKFSVISKKKKFFFFSCIYTLIDLHLNWPQDLKLHPFRHTFLCVCGIRNMLMQDRLKEKRGTAVVFSSSPIGCHMFTSSCYPKKARTHLQELAIPNSLPSICTCQTSY